MNGGLFNKTFFRFAFGFIATILFSVGVIVAVNLIAHKNDNTQAASAGSGCTGTC